MQASGQHHAPSALSPGKNPFKQPQSRSDVALDSNRIPDRAAGSPVVAPTALFCLHKYLST